jgi:hypothetical protein
MTNTFEYLGVKYTPIRQLTPKEQKTILRDIGSFSSKDPRFSKYNDGNWDHKEFYKKAAGAGAEEIDLFSIDLFSIEFYRTALFLPCENQLFHFLKSNY